MRFQFLFVGPTRGRDSRGRHNGSRDFHRRYDSNHRERDNRQDRRGNDDTSGENKQWRGNKNTKCFSCGAYGQIGRFCPKKGRTHNAESPKEEPSSSSNLVEHSHFTCLAEVVDESVINESVINKSVTNVNWAVESHFCPFENSVKNMSAVDNDETSLESIRFFFFLKMNAVWRRLIVWVRIRTVSFWTVVVQITWLEIETAWSTVKQRMFVWVLRKEELKLLQNPLVIWR